MIEILISPKPFTEYSAEEYHEYIRSMYALPKAKSGKLPAQSLTLKRTKKGALSIRRTKNRPFAYVTMSELATLATAVGASQTEAWNAFKKKGFIIAKDRLDAERIYGSIKEIPF